MSKLEKILSAVEKFWNPLEVSVVAREIENRNELPEWEDCGKREVYVGVKRRKKGDLLYVIRHRFEAEYDLTVPVENLDFIDEWYRFTGPGFNQVCSECREVSSTINIHGFCHDCKK